MAESRFQPGLRRLSVFDGVILALGTIASIALWSTTWWIGFSIAFVVAHFFLFCNVFRIARPLELFWAGIFVTLTYCTIVLEVLSWTASISITLTITFVLIAIEMKKPSYHGVMWQQINPNLPQWWADRKS